MKLCCVIVTYNRKELLLNNLIGILNQKIEDIKIYIIDNHGSDNTLEFLKDNFERMDLIDYTYLTENIGGAGGFSFGLKKAYDGNNEWFILMDDDGKPCENCFKELIDYVCINGYTSNDLILFNSLVTCDLENLSFGLGHFDNIHEIINTNLIDETGAINNNINPFNGTLISRGLVSKIGFPNKDFFIKGDEVDYTIRAQKAGAIIKTIFKSNYFHPKLTNRFKRKFFGHEMYVYVEAPWKEYYGARNYVYSLITNIENKKERRRQIRFFKFKRFLCVILTRCKKIKTWKMIKKGISDGKKGKLGPTYRP